MEELMKKNPWKGLQSYQEPDIIYGRDEEIKALYTRIIYNTQTVVYGKSGIGKSSIINAGITPRAKHDEMLPVAIRLAHTAKKEQTETSPYVEQIYNRIKEEVIKAGAELYEIVPHIVSHEETLWELLHRHQIWKGKDEERKRLIPLLIFDQFEEIFTLEISNKRVESFFSELADLLNEVKPSYLTPTEGDKATVNESPGESGKEKKRNVFSKIANRKRNTSPEYLEKSEFHLVITLREDFLSYLERYTAYIPVMKQNRFPLLPLNEEQAAKIITEPIKGLVQKDVAEIIIQRVTGRKDFKLDGIPEIEVDAALLSLYMEQLYERKGNNNNIISSELVQFNDDIIKTFYEKSIECISEKTIEYLEDELITNANRRNNVARIDIISGGVSEDDLDKLIEKKVLRQFSYGGDLRIEFIHDILCPIVVDRIEHRELLAKERDEQKKREEKETEERAKREKIERDAKKRIEEKELELKMKENKLLWYYRTFRIVFLLFLAYLSITSTFYQSKGTSFSNQIIQKYTFFRQTMLSQYTRLFILNIHIWLPILMIAFALTYFVLIRRTRWSRKGICIRIIGYLVMSFLICFFMYWLICSWGISTTLANLIAILISIAIYIFMVAGKDTATSFIQKPMNLFKYLNTICYKFI